jgi:phenylalanyl-tRNA synthetase alpha chain
MSLADFLADLDRLAREATTALAAAKDAEAVEAARIEFLGAKSGRLKAVQKGLGQVPPADKPVAGKRFNAVKQQIEAALEEAQQRAARQKTVTGAASRFDPTVPGIRPRLGHLHPITQTIEELKDIMGRLGFTVADGPEVEDPWHNFDALNIPPEHPARDPLDNFYLAVAGKQTPSPPAPLPEVEGSSSRPPLPQTGEGSQLLLRSQTSTVQIRVMEKTRPPVRIISLGRVYRPDTADPTHYPMFHQIEGLLVDRHVTMADLKSVLRLFAKSFFEDDVHIRFRPSFFPFTEPSAEVDVSCIVCGGTPPASGKRCSMCGGKGWLEIMGAGMVNPKVFEKVGYDPAKVTGFAFGMGVERIAILKYGITDIRLFFENDVRFLRQF